VYYPQKIFNKFVEITNAKVEVFNSLNNKDKEQVQHSMPQFVNATSNLLDGLINTYQY